MSAIERFWAKVDRDAPNGCWEWTGAISKSGYGAFRDADSKMVGAHRFSFEMAFGATDAQAVMHLCDNRICVNPAHLAAGSFKENMRDAARKGRMRRTDGEHSAVAKLTWDDVHVIRRDYARGGVSQAELGRRFGVTSSCIRRVLSNENWKVAA